jgi:DNA-binding transcriptional regulator YhcF (GntR family)
MKGEFDNSQPIFRQIIEQILLSIATGEFVPGGRVASVRELALKFKVNPNTMQRSLAELESMGYMFTERSSGRFVTRDTALIESLKSTLPKKITEKYVSEMLGCGFLREDITDYVKNYLESTNKHKTSSNLHD